MSGEAAILNLLHKLQRCRIHAIAQPGRLRTVVEYMPQMRGALGASHRCPNHAEGRVSNLANILFRKALGMRMHQYVIQRRVERAKTLLREDSLSMAEIAQAAGFAHQSHMARHMRRVLGVAPLAMKRMLYEAAAAD